MIIEQIRRFSHGEQFERPQAGAYFVTSNHVSDLYESKIYEQPGTVVQTTDAINRAGIGQNDERSPNVAQNEPQSCRGRRNCHLGALEAHGTPDREIWQGITTD